MRKTNDKTLKEAIEQMLQVYKIKRRYDETAIIAKARELGAQVKQSLAKPQN